MAKRAAHSFASLTSDAMLRLHDGAYCYRCSARADVLLRWQRLDRRTGMFPHKPACARCAAWAVDHDPEWPVIGGELPHYVAARDKAERERRAAERAALAEAQNALFDAAPFTGPKRRKRR